DKLQRENEEVTAALQRLAANLENIERSRSSEKLCKSAKLAEFMKEVELSSPDTCPPSSMEIGLNFLRLVPYSNIFFNKASSINNIHVVRKEYLKDLLASKAIHPSTRLLVLVQPAGDSQLDRREALHISAELVKMLQTEILKQDSTQIIGPNL